MSSPLSRLVSQFNSAFAQSLEAAADPALRPFIDSVRGVKHGLAEPVLGPHRDHPALRFLDEALVSVRAVERLCSAIRDLVPYLSFGSSYALDGPFAAVARGMVWAEIAGLNGLVRDSSRRLGCFLLAPGHHYPLHGHVADEIYFVVSGPLTVEHGFAGTRVDVAPGRYYRTPSEQPHALHIGDAPVLLVYCWVGDLTAAPWFLEKDAAGRWQRIVAEVVRR
jgi:mannose-6-phosphate isomerase-like protein (cupin superfamily)